MIWQLCLVTQKKITSAKNMFEISNNKKKQKQKKQRYVTCFLIFLFYFAFIYSHFNTYEFFSDLASTMAPSCKNTMRPQPPGGLWPPGTGLIGG